MSDVEGEGKELLGAQPRVGSREQLRYRAKGAKTTAKEEVQAQQEKPQIAA